MDKTSTLSRAQEERQQKKYSYGEVLDRSLKYFGGDELAATTWMNKYAVRDKEGNYLESTPNDMHRRMAEEFARIESSHRSAAQLNGSFASLSNYGQERAPLDAQQIFNYFKDFRYIIPQGSVMASLGNKQVLASLSNCVVMPSPVDSYGGVFRTDEQLAQLFKRRCGVGIDISTLRPSGSEVANAAQTTSGAVSFMERFSNTTREVAQNGRRGALMLTMDIAHPDVKDFITVKQDLTKVTGANVSVRISDEFMKAVESGSPFKQRWPIDAEEPTVVKEVDARELWNELISCAHNTAEPGVIFWDRQHFYSTSSVYPGFKNVSTNPCSEIAMQGGDSCRLIALNLYSFIEDPFTDKARFNKEKFYRVTYEAQRLMDDLVDLELEAIERIMKKIENDPEDEVIKANELATWQLLYDTGKKGRRTGLGFTALADALAALGLSFDSQEAIDATEEIMQIKLKGEFDSSIDMAIERGKFEIFDPKTERTSEFVQMMKKEFPDHYKRMMKYGRRNISISTVAPTGTLSLLAQTSSGIEPLFMTSYTRRRKLGEDSPEAKVAYVDDMGDRWEEFTVYHPKLKEWMRISGEADEARSPYFGCTAGEIDWKKRIELQSVIQKYVTHSISSTINLPADTPVDLVDQIYREAWKHGLKGITVYRDGSRSGVLIGKEDKKEEKKEESGVQKRPKRLHADVLRFYNEHEAWIAVIGVLNGRPYEVFTGKAQDAFYLPEWVDKGWVIKKRKKNGQARYDFQYMDKDGFRVTIEGLSRSFNPEYWNYAKLISGVLRHGMPIAQVVDLIADLKLYDESINTWKNGVARALKKFIPDGTTTDHQCPECGDPQGLVYEEGCLQCKNCGHSKCG